jgi:hypothetical protein
MAVEGTVVARSYHGFPAFTGTAAGGCAPGLLSRLRGGPVSIDAGEEMEKERSTVQTGDGAGHAGQERKRRLAEALRRNLVKRKDKKETNPEGKSVAD